MTYGQQVTTLGVTGQRPKSLGLSGFNLDDSVWLDAALFVQESLDMYKPERLVSGGALGFDMVAAKVAVESGVALKLALPFEGFDAWGQRDKRRLRWLIKHAADAVYVCEPGYAPWKYQWRNEYIVHCSDYMIAWHNGAPGGTKNCLDYAVKQGVPYTVRHPITKDSYETV